MIASREFWLFTMQPKNNRGGCIYRTQFASMVNDRSSARPAPQLCAFRWRTVWTKRPSVILHICETGVSYEISEASNEKNLDTLSRVAVVPRTTGVSGAEGKKRLAIRT